LGELDERCELRKKDELRERRERGARARTPRLVRIIELSGGNSSPAGEKFFLRAWFVSLR
jgi:hypothetical protein